MAIIDYVLETTSRLSVLLPCANPRISEVSSGGYRNCYAVSSAASLASQDPITERPSGAAWWSGRSATVMGSDRFWREVNLSLQDH